ncbi:hypothetical protein MHM93_14685 [Pseudoalteromonas sp. MM17-2]|uniref:hypothetical protein n=1 Tax=Pseudoalteromonas sp. MM17-2 TaxID=2917753 RepID=UPI001EF70F5A|nr:hypothetical protein [Pseudoalteromonas sp. MM17-2]MCG7545425.1 hypothetical protein [Pseudoalteromonas sp. MM17-2]
MKLLLRLAAGDVRSQLPDDSSLFKDQSVVTIEGQQYLYTHYIGSKAINSDHDVSSYLSMLAGKKIPSIDVTNIGVTGTDVELGAGGIWWVKEKTQFNLTANAELQDSSLMVIIEKVVNGREVIGDIRVKATITGGRITIQGRFDESGNYILRASRLNQGLEEIGAPFRLSFATVEFDTYVA